MVSELMSCPFLVPKLFWTRLKCLCSGPKLKVFWTQVYLLHFFFAFQLEILEEMRRERIDELATLIQKIYRGHLTRLKFQKLRESQVVISTCWKRWKDKSHISESKQRRQENWATLIIQKFFRLWQVCLFIVLGLRPIGRLACPYGGLARNLLSGGCKNFNGAEIYVKLNLNYSGCDRYVFCLIWG